jgi:Pentapeptide repeats (9 copies)
VTLAWGAVVAAVLLLFALAIFVLPPLLVDEPLTRPQEIKAKNDVRGQLLQGLAATALIAGLYFTWRTLRLNTQGQITDRFTKAVDQLGDENVDVRVGGIYALARIGRDSRADQAAISHVLVASIRRATAKPQPQAPPDVQAAMSVLTDRGFERPRMELGVPLDLSGLGLRRLDLAEANLRRLDFRGAHLEDSDLRGAWLDEADLRGARLERAELFLASFRKADLRDAYFDEADVGRASFEGADLRGAHFAKVANLDDVRSLDGAWFDESTEWPDYLEADEAEVRGAKQLRFSSGMLEHRALAGPALRRERPLPSTKRATRR